MTLDEYLAVGRKEIIGNHTFSSEEIRRFAEKFDPQPFHMDEDAARNTLFGALCASGWHTGSAWMRCHILSNGQNPSREWNGPGERPEFGPSPGIRDLKWIRPVFAGETITFSRTALSHRPHRRRPGWHILEILAEGHDQSGGKVIEFIAEVLIRHEGDSDQ